mmetsp:Transcript_46420/g.92861  ORF Transcript_46420/g.92861 Transcript_46420/m.92861 type:complete len:119 (+) Transcript_46420:39-395(+)
MLRAAVLVALIAAAAAFSAPAMSGLQLRSGKTAMTMKSEGPVARVNANVAKALAPAVAAFSVAAPAFAEGTGEALGVDDGRLLVPIIIIPVFVALLFGNFASTQDNEDFFDTYDQRRK